MPRPALTKRKRDRDDEGRDSMWDPPSHDEEFPTMKRQKPLRRVRSKNGSNARDLIDDEASTSAEPQPANAPASPKQQRKPTIAAPSSTQKAEKKKAEIPATPEPQSKPQFQPQPVANNPFAVVKKKGKRGADSADGVKEGIVGFFKQEEIQALEKFKLDFCNSNGIGKDTFDMMVQHSARDKEKFPCDDPSINRVEFWRVIYEQLPQRDRRSVYRFMRRHFQFSTQKPHQWTREQEDELVQLHAQYGPKWTQIARMIGRSDDDVVQRWKNRLEHRATMNWGPWTEEEVRLLQNTIQTIWKRMRDQGEHVGEDLYAMDEKMISWGHVSAALGYCRSRQQCADKWRKARRKVEQLRSSGDRNAIFDPVVEVKPRKSGSRSQRGTPGHNTPDWRYKSSEYVGDDSEDGDGQGQTEPEDKVEERPSKRIALSKKSVVDRTPVTKSKYAKASQVEETPEPETNVKPTSPVAVAVTKKDDAVKAPTEKSNSDDNSKSGASSSDEEEEEEEEDNAVAKAPASKKNGNDSPSDGPSSDDEETDASSSNGDEDEVDEEEEEKASTNKKNGAGAGEVPETQDDSEGAASDEDEDEEEGDEEEEVASKETAVKAPEKKDDSSLGEESEEEENDDEEEEEEEEKEEEEIKKDLAKAPAKKKGGDGSNQSDQSSSDEASSDEDEETDGKKANGNDSGSSSSEEDSDDDDTDASEVEAKTKPKDTVPANKTPIATSVKNTQAGSTPTPQGGLKSSIKDLLRSRLSFGKPKPAPVVPKVEEKDTDDESESPSSSEESESESDKDEKSAKKGAIASKGTPAKRVIAKESDSDMFSDSD